MSVEDSVHKVESESIKTKQKNAEKKDDKDKNIDKSQELKNEEERRSIIPKTQEVDYSTSFPIKSIKTTSIKAEKYEPVTETSIAKSELKDTISIPIRLETKILPNINKKKVEVSTDSKPISTYTDLSTSTSIPLQKVIINKPEPLINNIKAKLPEIPPKIDTVNLNNESSTVKKERIQISNNEVQKPIKVTSSIPQVTAQDTKARIVSSEAETTIDEGAGEVYLDLLTTLFESEDRKDNLGDLLVVSRDKPVVILAERVEDEEYIETLKHILLEIYRIKVGGFPRAEVIRGDKRKVEEVEAERRIVVIHDTDVNFFEEAGVNKHDEDSVDPKKFLERIEELFSQGLGYIIIHASKERLERVKSKLVSYHEKIPKLLYLRPKRFETEDRKFNLVSAVWGFVEPMGLTGKSLDKIFLSCEKIWNNILEDLVKTPKYAWVKGSLEDEEGSEGYESELHYLLKIFIASYFIEKGKSVETEYELQKQKCIADLFIKEDGLAVEIETLYGTGIYVWRKIERTIEKYGDTNYKLWIVIPNLQMTLYLKGIINLRNMLKKKGKLIEFYTVNLKEKKLISLDEYSKNFKKKD
jgi:hypothetical protein